MTATFDYLLSFGCEKDIGDSRLIGCRQSGVFLWEDVIEDISQDSSHPLHNLISPVKFTDWTEVGVEPVISNYGN